MLFALNLKLQQNKLVLSELIRVKGVGYFYKKLICGQLGFCINLKVKSLSIFQKNKIDKFINLRLFTANKKFKKLKHPILKVLFQLIGI